MTHQELLRMHPVDRTRFNCATCQGTGWSAFFSGGGTVCAGCGGSGRRADQQQPRPRVRLEEPEQPRRRVRLERPGLFD